MSKTTTAPERSTADLIRASLKQHGTVASLCARLEVLETEVKQSGLELQEASKLFIEFLPGVADIYRAAAARNAAVVAEEAPSHD